MENSLKLVEEYGSKLFEEYKNKLINFRNKTASLNKVKIYMPNNYYAYDYGKLVITAGINSGAELYRYLYEEHHLVMEMKSKDYVIAMTSIFDTDEGFDRLSEALYKSDKRESFFKLDNKIKFDYTLRSGVLPERKLLPSEAVSLSAKYGRKVELEDSKGLISADYVYFYPPGIPLLVPGEVIGEDIINQIKAARFTGIEIYGGCDGNGIFVCAYW